MNTTTKMTNDLELLTEANFLKWIKKKLKSVKGRLGRASVKKGHIITYDYRSKLFAQDKLDYYDKHPLVVVTSSNSLYFWGFNIHYLPQILRDDVVEYLEHKYPKEFAKPNYTKSLPGFSYDKFKVQFPYIAQVLIKCYIRKNATGITAISTEEYKRLTAMDTSKFVFKSYSEFKSIEDLYTKWKKSKHVLPRNRRIGGSYR